MARPRRSDGTRNRLLDEGVAAFTERGYHGAGLKEILDRCDVPKGSFYNYFASKEEFGAAAIQHYAGAFGGQLADATRGAPDPVTGLERFFRRLMAEFAAGGFTGGCLVANLAGELEGSEVCRAALQTAFNSWRDAVADLLDQGQQRGLVRKDGSARDLADLLTEAWEGAVIRMKIEHSLAPLERCITLFLRGFLAEGR
jgi:TetR/AcrR family transcriptional regulator, transcriptional repressor for nem operon